MIMSLNISINEPKASLDTCSLRAPFNQTAEGVKFVRHIIVAMRVHTYQQWLKNDSEKTTHTTGFRRILILLFSYFHSNPQTPVTQKHNMQPIRIDNCLASQCQHPWIPEKLDSFITLPQCNSPPKPLSCIATCLLGAAGVKWCRLTAVSVSDICAVNLILCHSI